MGRCLRRILLRILSIIFIMVGFYLCMLFNRFFKCCLKLFVDNVLRVMWEIWCKDVIW